MGGTYRAWNDTIRRWPPPNGWYRADDGRWWAPGTGPNPPGRPPLSHPPSPTVRLDPSPRPNGPSGTPTGEPNGITLNDDGPRVGTSPDDRPAFAARTADTALLPLTASPPLTPVALPGKPRLITRVAVVLAGVALGLATGAGVITALITTGRIDELPGITIDRPAEAASIPTTDPAPIEPWTFEQTTVTTRANVSEARMVDEPTQRIARFSDLIRIDEVANSPGTDGDVRSGLAG